jgi:hypothetical protein
MSLEDFSMAFVLVAADHNYLCLSSPWGLAGVVGNDYPRAGCIGLVNDPIPPLVWYSVRSSHNIRLDSAERGPDTHPEGLGAHSSFDSAYFVCACVPFARIPPVSETFLGKNLHSRGFDLVSF